MPETNEIAGDADMKADINNLGRDLAFLALLSCILGASLQHAGSSVIGGLTNWLPALASGIGVLYVIATILRRTRVMIQKYQG